MLDAGQATPAFRRKSKMDAATILADLATIGADLAALTADPAVSKLENDVEQLAADLGLAALKGELGDLAVSSDATQDTADIASAIAAGLGGRFALGPYRAVTLAVRNFRADGDSAAYSAAMSAALTPNPARACRIATMAVIGLQIAEAFGVSIPASVLAEAIALQQSICGTPVPVPTLPVISPTA